MNLIDLVIFIVYILAMLGVGIFFMITNKDTDDYYVGGRKMTKWHIGLSVVATDVGGGFTIGLGGLGFLMGISGSWMLFTGLIGAWLTAAVLIPKVYDLGKKYKFLTFPQIFNFFYNNKVAAIAAIISAIGYLGLTSSQILAGAKLASASFTGLSMTWAVVIMGSIAVIYTFMGGLKAVIYTDTIQWIILMGGLVFIGVPMGYFAVGGYEEISKIVSDDMLSLTNIRWQDIVKWGVTIIPLWFVGMTLYQRIYASKDKKSAKKAWFIAGVFEYPIMAFMGVLLGLFSRVAAEQGMFEHLGYMSPADMDSEMGLPLLLKNVLPIGLMGLMMAAYFSAIMSTADSCLMAASGNITTDIISRIFKIEGKKSLITSQITTLIIGTAAILIATLMSNVIDLMLYSYAIMVSGLFIPLLGALFWRRSSIWGAIIAMFSGGGLTIALTEFKVDLLFDLDPNLFGILTSFILFVSISLMAGKKRPSVN